MVTQANLQLPEDNRDQSFGMSSVVLFVLVVCLFSSGECGVFGKIKSGLEAAGKWFGLGKGSGLAKLVAESFGKNGGEKHEDNSKGVFSAFFRILGFDAKKIGAIAVNAIIFIAQMVINFVVVHLTGFSKYVGYNVGI